MALRDEAQRIAHERGLNISDAEVDLEYPAVEHAEFYRSQIASIIHHRWNGQFDNARADNPKVCGWTDAVIDGTARYTSLLLTGQTGRGKTRQAIGVVRKMVEMAADRGLRLDWRFITHSFLGEETRGDGGDAALTPYLDTDLLVLDDIGAGLETNWGRDVVERLVDHRWSHRMMTVYTTNLDTAALTARVGSRVYSRVGDSFSICLTGPDWRQSASQDRPSGGLSFWSQPGKGRHGPAS